MFLRSLYLCLLWLVCSASLVAADAQKARSSQFDEAAAAYERGDYEGAFQHLAHAPGLLGVIPLLDQPGARDRARIFFDLGRIRLAAGDTARARQVLTHVFAIDPNADGGVMRVSPDDAFEQTRIYLAHLRIQRRNQKLRATTSLGGALRSLVLPGWGQLYRGHAKRGRVFFGAAAGLGVLWFFADQSYRSAYRAYRETRVEDLLRNRTGAASDPLPFKERFERAEKRARRANIVLGTLAAVWMASVLDNLVVGPAQVLVVLPIR